jgi:hypothetical protein
LNDNLGKTVSFLSRLVFLCSPAIPLMREHTGWTGVLAYFLFAAAVLLILFRFTRPLHQLVRKGYPILLGLFMLVLLAVLAVVYPMETAGKISFGSDRDEMINLSAQTLFSGRHPFSETTPLGHLISVLPGAIFLAAPFVALGNGAYQNIFWMILLV